MNPLMNTTDQELALRIKTGEKEAFRELFNRYAPRIFKFAFSYLKNKDDAKELIQNVFLKIWEKRDLIDPKQNIKAFIFTITVNMIYDFIRRRNIEHAFHTYTRLNQTENENQPWDSIVYNEMHQTLSNLVTHLPKQQQEIFNLSKMEGLTNNEIAQKMGLSKRTVENHLYHAVSYLKHNLKYELQVALLFVCSTCC